MPSMRYSSLITICPYGGKRDYTDLKIEWDNGTIEITKDDIDRIIKRLYNSKIEMERIPLVILSSILSLAFSKRGEVGRGSKVDVAPRRVVIKSSSRGESKSWGMM